MLQYKCGLPPSNMCRAPRLPRLSVVWNIQTQNTRLTCIKIDIQIRLIHANVDDHLYGAVNCYLEKAASFSLCGSNSIKTLKEAVFLASSANSL